MTTAPPRLGITDDEVRALGEGGFLVRDGVVSAEQVQAWADALDALDTARSLTPAGVGRGRRQHEELRGDRTMWLEGPDDGGLRGLFELFDAVRGEVNQAAWLGLRAFEVQLAVYPGDGARYVAHHDAFAGDAARRLTAILYLNPSWSPEDGGCLRVWLENGPAEVEPLGGRLVLFLSSELEHEVLPTSATRRAATAWYRGGEALVDPGWDGR